MPPGTLKHEHHIHKRARGAGPSTPNNGSDVDTLTDWGDTGADPYQAGMAVGYAAGGTVDQSWDNFDWLKNFNKTSPGWSQANETMTTPTLPSYGGGNALPTSPAQTALQGVANSNRSAFSPMPTVGGAITSPSARPYQPSSIPTATPAPSPAPTVPTTPTSGSGGWSQFNETMTAPSNYSGVSTIGAPGLGPGGQAANGTMTLARGGPVGYANGGTVQPSADMNHRAALLAGLRKRYDAMIGMAQGALAHRDENAAVRFAQRAHDMVPDGKSLILHVQPDGNVLAIVHDPRGGEQSRHIMTPDQFHHYLIGPATSFDHVIENGVGHNLGIASGRPTPRMPEHPADPIHKVRQVLHHTRRMFGIDKIGQAPPRVGYAAGGPVRGYDDGGEVYPSYYDYSNLPSPDAYGGGAPIDDTPPPEPQWTAQDERDNPPPDEGARTAGSLDDYLLNARRGAASAPAQRTQEAPATGESGMGELLSRAGSKLYGGIDERIRADQAARAEVLPKAWGSMKQALADYINGANAASPEELSQAKQNEANQNPNLSTPEVVQNVIAGPPDPNVNQLPAAEAPAETTAPSTATTDPQERTEGTNNRPAEVPASWATNAGYTPRTGYFTKEGAAQGQPAATGYQQDQGMLPRQPSKADLRPAGFIKTPDGRFPVNHNGEIIKPDGTLEFTPPNQSQRTVIDPRTGERLEMTGGTGTPIRPREGTPGGTGVRGSLNRPFGLSAKDTAYKQLSASGALDIVPSDKYGRSPEAQASEGARPWTQDMARRAAAGEAPMPRGAPPMYVTERPAPYYDPSTGQVVTPDRQVMPQSGPPVGVAPGSPEAGKPPAWQPPPNIPGAVGQQPPADDQSPAARAARAFPMASQTRQRVQYQGTLERQAQEDQLKRESYATRDTPESRMARAKLADDGKTFRSLAKDQQTQYHTDMQGVIADNNRFERAYEAVQRNVGGAAAELLKDYRAKTMNDPNYKPNDDELGAMVHAHDLIFGSQGAAPPAQVPKPVAPLPQGGVAPATPAQQSPQSVLRVPQPAQNLVPAPQLRQPAPAAIQALKADPRRRAEFDNYYGPGASARYLGQ
jgi:hypothetical protein